MKLSIQQLTSHLKNNLACAYIIHGDEPLLIEDAVEQIKYSAMQRGYDEYEKISLESINDFNTLWSSLNIISLFNSKKIIEAIIDPEKTGNIFWNNLAACAKYLNSETCLILKFTNRLTKKVLSNSCLKLFESNSVFLAIYKITPQEFHSWLNRQCTIHKIILDEDAMQFLAQHTGYNLHESLQVLIKLNLCDSCQPKITSSELKKHLTTQISYEVYDLSAALISTQFATYLKILTKLRANNTPPLLAIWSLAKELRLIAELKPKLFAGIPVAELSKQYQLWNERATNIYAAARNLPLAKIQSWLYKLSELDLLAKGINDTADLWDEVARLAI